MGYVWLIPIVSGIIYSRRFRNERLLLLLLFTGAAIALVFSQVAYYINPYGVSVVNPRDLLPIAPLLVVCVSIAFCSFSDWLSNRNQSKNGIIIPALLALYFGLLSYIHSVFLYFGTIVLPGVTYVISRVLIIFGLTLPQTTLQISPAERVGFASVHGGTILVLSLAIVSPFVLIALLKKLKSFKVLNQEALQNVRDGYSQFLRSIRWSSISDGQRRLLKHGVFLTLLLSVIVLPRGIILAAQGGPYESHEFQLSRYYGPLYELLENHESVVHGDILTFSAPEGIPYYIEDVNIIDLRYAANIAYLKDCFNSSTSFESAIRFKQKGIHHLLLDLSIITDIDDALNNTLSSLISNSTLTQVSQYYGNWILFDLGPFVC
jgi:hypothetical protein